MTGVRTLWKVASAFTYSKLMCAMTPSAKVTNANVTINVYFRQKSQLKVGEISQTEKGKYYMLSLIRGIYKIKQMNVYNKTETGLTDTENKQWGEGSRWGKIGVGD